MGMQKTQYAPVLALVSELHAGLSGGGSTQEERELPLSPFSLPLSTQGHEVITGATGLTCPK
jgi:hypothetical protein